MIKQQILKALILFYFVASFIGATHMHNDQQEHVDDCKICVIVAAFNNGDFPKYTLELVCETCRDLVEIGIEYLTIEYTYLKGFFAHAPPYLSSFFL